MSQSALLAQIKWPEGTMPMSISVSHWSDCSAEVLLAVQKHAARKARDPIDWGQWMQIDSQRFGGFDIPYPVGEVVHDVMQAFCGHRRIGWTHFVPYMFNDKLVDFPAPREFWFDEVQPHGWMTDTLTIIEGVWFHDAWRGINDDGYRQLAQQYACRFTEEYDKVKDQVTWNFNVYDFAYHYVEVGLMTCLQYALPRNLPVVIYP
jgi:hypothetical protein